MNPYEFPFLEEGGMTTSLVGLKKPFFLASKLLLLLKASEESTFFGDLSLLETVVVFAMWLSYTPLKYGCYKHYYAVGLL
jgi:hypothetical protein